jgi:hypothetical protein
MKTILLYIIILYNFIEKISNDYLSSDDFRDLVEIPGDFQSENYFKYFIMNLTYFQNNDPLFYYQKCKEDNFFGYFKFGSIQNYLSYENYGSFGINLHFILNTDLLNATKEDSVRFYLNDQLKAEIFLDNEELNKDISFPYNDILCEKNVRIYQLNLLLVNQRLDKYVPIDMRISSNIGTFSDVYWGISNLRYFKQECPPKCLTCNNDKCLSCGTKMTLKSGSCLCNTENEIFDFSDENERINCKGKLIKYKLITSIFDKI